MSPEPRTRPARPEDRAALLDLVKGTFGSDGLLHRTDFWTWKHERSPFGPSPMRVAEVGGDIVAVRAFLRWSFLYGTHEVPAVRAVDTATRSDWRGQGLFTRLTLELAQELKSEGVGLVFNTPNETSRPGYLRMGWHRVRRVPVWIRVRGPGARRGPCSEEDGADPGEPIDRLLDHPELSGLLRSLAAEEKTRADRYRTDRNAAYLRWRYREIPGFTYRVLYELSSSGEQGAALVFRSRERGRRRELDVAEILASPQKRSIQSATRLLRQLARECQVSYLAACAPSRSPEARVLVRAGFLPVPWVGPRLVVRRLALPLAASAPERWSSWHLGLGDLEIF